MIDSDPNETDSGTRTAMRPPRLSDEGRSPTEPVPMLDQSGETSWVRAAVERALTIAVDGDELVTLMTIGSHPEHLVLGYLRNQGLFENPGEIESVFVDWQRELASVTTRSGGGLGSRRDHRPASLDVYPRTLHRDEVYRVIEQVPDHNHVYRSAGSVHGCGLFRNDDLLFFVEDVGRHNATDALSGWMWLRGLSGTGMILYCTGRLTTEIVSKASLMGISVVISRNGVTNSAVDLAEESRVMLVARARRRNFQVFSCHERLTIDATDSIDL